MEQPNFRNLESMRLERLVTDPSAVHAIPSWQQNKDLFDWLRSL
jgi:TusA-related sulfurtransferase